MVILGVDPGSVRTGWGVIETDGRRHRLVEMGVIAPPPRLDLPRRLRAIHEGVCALLARLHPEALAVEDCFHHLNTRTALVLGHVRGAVLLAGAQAGLPVHEYPPATVKAQVVGTGRAEKAQVAFMVARSLDLPGAGDPGDAADALAVALCCAHQMGLRRTLAAAPRRPRPRPPA